MCTLVSAEAFHRMVFSSAEPKDPHGQGQDCVWLEEEAESVASLANTSLGKTKAKRSGKN